MESRTSTGGPGRMPGVQHKTGTGREISKNPKNNSSRRTDVMGPVAGEGGAVLQQGGMFNSTTGFPATEAGAHFNAGSPGMEPDPAVIPCGYTRINGNNVPGVSKVVSSDRLFGIDPGAVTNIPAGDTDATPSKPSYGTGGQD